MVSNPLVSIGVPVYNDSAWLRNSLEHLLNQDYPRLEIILADDGSTDDSREICREYAGRDSRIRLFKNKHNLKALGNCKFVFDASSGDYFAWGSGHDYFHKSFVSKTLERLKANPSTVMCCTKSAFVDEEGHVLRTTKAGLDTRGLPPVKRFRKLMEHVTTGGTANTFYGLYRRDVLGQKDFFRKVSGWDIIMLAELSLLGEMTQVDEILYYRLIHKESRQEHSARHTEMLFGAHNAIPERFLYHFAASGEFLKMAQNFQLSAIEKQSIFEDIIELDVNMARTAISNEIDRLLVYSGAELHALEPYPQLRQYRAAQLLTMLEEARLLGFYTHDMCLIKSTCLSVLNLDGEARITSEGERPNKIIAPYRWKYKGVYKTLFGPLSSKARKLLRRIKFIFSRTRGTSL